MKILLLLSVVLITACSSLKNQEFDCGMGPSWAQFFPDQQITKTYISAIETYQKSLAFTEPFDGGKAIFWYKNDRGLVQACVLSKYWKRERGNCSTQRYKLSGNMENDFKVVNGEIVVCT